MENTRARTTAVEWYIALVFALGAGLFTVSFYLEPVDEPGGLLLVVALASLSEWLSVHLQREGRASLGSVAIVFAALTFGPPGGALVVAAITIVGWAFFSRRETRRLLFNFGQQNIAGFAAGGFALIFGRGFVGENAAVVLGVGLLAGLAVFAITSWAVAIVLALTTKDSVGPVYRSNFLSLLPHYGAYGIVGGILAVTYERFGMVGILIPVVPLLLARYSMKQVLDNTRANVTQLEASNGRLQVANVEISSMRDELKVAYTGTLESLTAALDVRDQETKGHSVRVATHSLQMAQMLGMKGEEELGMIYRGALMHDVGKIGVPDNILLKPGPLTEEEWIFMRRHPAMGYKILAQVPYLRPTAKIVLAHHERWDGDGYPRKLKGEQIPLGARIFSIADTYDAIISDRPYREGKSPELAFAEILRCSGAQFDPKVIEAFEALFPKWAGEATDRKPRALILPSWSSHDDELLGRAG